ncbi:MAG: DUF58 domain-containing protein [Acidobacteriota bacterium]|nr:DUF58 domain-containing protein [Acidobacteriota bacterium]
MTAAVTDRLRLLGPRVEDWRERATEAARLAQPVVSRVARAASMVSPLGRTVAVIGVLAWIGGWWLGWNELMVLAGASLLLLVFAGLFVIGKSSVSIDVRLEPPRVVAGDSSAGQVTVRNSTGRRSLPCQVELPVGRATALFDVVTLGPGEETEELFIVPTERRGVIPVGPATSLRGDPLGIFHRKAASSPPSELIVHPHTVPLSPFGSGLLRDLEGRTTADLSPSDLAFHALREYAPGDDRRHVHWRSSARTGRLLVRQFLDTRRSTLCAVVDSRPTAYGDESEFELALEVAGSIALRACRDGLSSVVAAGDQAAVGVLPHTLLDALSRASLSRKAADLPTMVGRATAQGADISYALLVSGSTSTDPELQRAAARFPIDVRVIAIRVQPGQRPGIVGRGRASILNLGELSDLPPLLRMEMPV